MMPAQTQNLLEDAVGPCEHGCPGWHQIDLMIQELGKERTSLISTCEKQKETIASMRAALIVAQKIIAHDREVLWEKVQRDAEDLRRLSTGLSTPYGSRIDKTCPSPFKEESERVDAASRVARYEVTELRMWLIVCATFKHCLAIWRSTARCLIVVFNELYVRTRSRRQGLASISRSEGKRAAILHKPLVTSGIVVAILMGVVVGLLLSDLLSG